MRNSLNCPICGGIHSSLSCSVGFIRELTMTPAERNGIFFRPGPPPLLGFLSDIERFELGQKICSEIQLAEFFENMEVIRREIKRREAVRFEFEMEQTEKRFQLAFGRRRKF